ncbi:glycosyl hydrolase [Thiosulfatimonas sediminis]|uniref:Glycosyl hydrolase n=1 Tax=Thiosulfatimonas sediminis TaxID=2675054 RepID=A0A6F8PRJ7_9GAMM|nr:glycosyltransferase family 39 protein [Thiosulfatimonas sediminis]BBP44706.1 glycosyl hydrolase [Thiosulfatimonas sediminis]
MRNLSTENGILSYGMIALTLFFAFYANLWGVPLFDLDEGAFSEATREMLASGNFAATYLDGVPRFDKPIFSYWMQALSVSTFGINEFAFRLPSAVAATLWVLATYQFAKQQWNPTTGIYAALFMATTLWVAGIGRAAIADAWLNLFIALTLFDMWRYRQNPNQTLLLRVYFWMALGLLTKGPVAIAIPFLSSAIFFIWGGQWRLWLSAIFNPLGWLVLALTVSPWLYLVYQDQGIDFFKGFILDHNLQRFSDTREGHGGNYFYYFLVLPLIIMPFSGLLFSAIRHAKSLLKDDLNRYLLIWFAVVFALVSYSQTQLPHYVMYGVTGLILVFAANREKLAVARWHLWLAFAFLILLAALPWIIAIAVENTHRAYEKALLAQYQTVFSWDYYVAAGALLIVAVGVILQKNWPVANRLIVIGLAQTIFVFHFVIEVAADLQQQPVKNAAAYATQHSDKKVVTFGIKMPSFSVYRQKITPRDRPQAGNLVFTRIDQLEHLQQTYPQFNSQVVFQEGGILLVEMQVH